MVVVWYDTDDYWRNLQFYCLFFRGRDSSYAIRRTHRGGHDDLECNILEREAELCWQSRMFQLHYRQCGYCYERPGVKQ